MAIDDPRNISGRFQESDQAAPPLKLRAGESIARNRLGGGPQSVDEPQNLQMTPTARQFEPSSQQFESAFEVEEAGGADDNPLLKSLGSLFSAPAAETQAPRQMLMAGLDNVLNAQPQMAGALALGGLVAGCAVGAIALGLGGAIITFAFEAIAFAGGVLVSRAGQKQLMEATEKLRFEASHDGMTGLLNRKSIMTGLDEIQAKSTRAGLSYAVLMSDVDHFKKINDTYGHQGGDDVLKAVAGRLRECLREGALEGRYGGEEFLVVMPDSSSEMAYAAAERVRQAIARDPITTEYGTIPVTVSIGVAASDRAGTDPQKLLRAADEALYRAKNGGRNRVEVALAPV